MSFSSQEVSQICDTERAFQIRVYSKLSVSLIF